MCCFYLLCKMKIFYCKHSTRSRSFYFVLSRSRCECIHGTKVNGNDCFSRQFRHDHEWDSKLSKCSVESKQQHTPDTQTATVTATGCSEVGCKQPSAHRTHRINRWPMKVDFFFCFDYVSTTLTATKCGPQLIYIYLSLSFEWIVDWTIGEVQQNNSVVASMYIYSVLLLTFGSR